MANPSTAHEPSMEEILASIRQIISEDGEGPSQPQPEAAGAVPAEDQPSSEARPAPSERAAAPQPQTDPAHGASMKAKTSESAAKAAPQPSLPAHVPEPPRRPEFASAASSPSSGQHRARRYDDDGLLSEESDAAVSGAFSVLAHTILAQNARTLEDLVIEMLRPMLKEWLDDNLPPLVERQVQEEIARVSRGRR